MTNQPTEHKEHIGVIGLGHMGSPMVRRLIDAGYPLTIYNRTSERTHEAAQWGASVAHTPEELAAHNEVILTIVTDDEALADVTYGQQGVLAGAHAGMTIIDMSTVSPDSSRRLYQEAKKQGVSMIDAAVSGSVPQVEQGKLVIFVGGDEETYQRYKPILAVLGENSFYMGASGMGTTMKLVVNTLLGLGMQALAEAIALGQKAGLEKHLLLDVLGQTAVLTPGQKSKLTNVGHEQYATAFALSLMHKDFHLVLSQAEALSVAMPATAAAQQMYTAATAQGMEGDFSIMIHFMEMLAHLHESQ